MIECNKGKCKLSIDNKHLDLVRDFFSEPVPGAAIAYNKGYNVPFFKSVIGATGTFNSGLKEEVTRWLYNNGFIQEELEEIADKEREITLPSLDLPLRDYQKKAVTIAINNGSGIIVAGTGAGKTLMMSYLLEYEYSQDPDFKAIVIVPDIGLVDQTRKDFASYRCNFTYKTWTGSNSLTKETTDCNVVICNIKIIQAQPKNFDKIKGAGMIIVDEAHKINSKSELHNIVSKCGACRTYGFTGTMHTSLLERWYTIGTLGPVIYRKDSHELREENFLANVTVKRLCIEYRDPPMGKYNEELSFISQNKFRNTLIEKLSFADNNNTLILVNTIEHGETIYNNICNYDKKVFFIRGDMPVEERRSIIEYLEDNNDCIVVAMSQIFSTGINIKNIHSIIFGFAGKSFIRIIQSIGRGLRQHKDKKALCVYDIVDVLEYSMRHGSERELIYDAEKIKYTTYNIVEKQ